MYFILAGICLVLWLFGVLYHYSMAGFINLLPAIAVLVILLRVIGGPKSYGILIGSRMKERIELFRISKTVSIIILASGLVLLMMGLNGVEHLNSDASQFFNGTASESVFWMLIAGNVAAILGIVTLISTLRKEIKTKTEKNIHPGLS